VTALPMVIVTASITANGTAYAAQAECPAIHYDSMAEIRGQMLKGALGELWSMLMDAMSPDQLPFPAKDFRSLAAIDVTRRELEIDSE